MTEVGFQGRGGPCLRRNWVLMVELEEFPVRTTMSLGMFAVMERSDWRVRYVSKGSLLHSVLRLPPPPPSSSTLLLLSLSVGGEEDRPVRGADRPRGWPQQAEGCALQEVGVVVGVGVGGRTRRTQRQLIGGGRRRHGSGHGQRVRQEPGW